MSNTYYEKMEQSLPSKARIRKEQKKLEGAGVKYILSCWIDMLGVPQFAVHSVSFVPELGPADSDQIPVPDLDTLVICPWDPTCAWVFADLWWEGKPYNMCPRQALKRAIRDAGKKGYAMMAGIEPE